jgi:hypothetical protein
MTARSAEPALIEVNAADCNLSRMAVETRDAPAP